MNTPPNLPEQFHAPAGWTGKSFGANDELYGGFAFPEGEVLGAVAMLGGRSEPHVKYFEMMRDFLARGIAVFIYDTRGQGISKRYLANPEKGHSGPFEQHVDDLGAFMREVVAPELDRRGLSHIRPVLYAHSTGGNIGLRALPFSLQRSFSAAVISSGMTGLKGIPTRLLTHIKPLMKPWAECYAPRILTGMNDWNEAAALSASAALTGDSVRGGVQPAWMKHNPALRHGGPTVGWVLEASASCTYLQKDAPLEDIGIPVMFVVGGDENLVDSDATRRIAQRLPNARLVEIPGAKHEIHMETDERRDQFWTYFDTFLADTGVLQSKLGQPRSALS